MGYEYSGIFRFMFETVSSKQGARGVGGWRRVVKADTTITEHPSLRPYKSFSTQPQNGNQNLHVVAQDVPRPLPHSCLLHGLPRQREHAAGAPRHSQAGKEIRGIKKSGLKEIGV